MTKILVVADIKQGELKGSTAELLSKARTMGAEKAVVAIGSATIGNGSRIGKRGLRHTIYCR